MSNVIISESRLKSMNIYELRVLLKKLGGTPLNKTSSQLIEEISEIQNGKTPLKKSNRGRKPKFAAQAEKENEIGIAKEEKNERKPFALAYEEIDSPEFKGRKAPNFANGVSSPVTPTVGSPDAKIDTVSVADGILVAEYDVPYCANYDVRCKYPVFLVEKNLVKTYGLKTGDRITGYAHSKNDEKYTVFEAEKINGKPRENFVRSIDFDKVVAAYPDELFSLDGENDSACRAIDLFSPIGKGARVAIIEGSRKNSIEIMAALAKELVKQAHVIYMPIGVAPEIIGDAIENIPTADIVATDFSSDSANALTRVYAYFEHAKRLVEQGENAVILLHSLDKVYEELKSFYGDEKSALCEIGNLISCAKNVKGGGSFTLIYALSSAARTPLISETERVNNCTVRLNDGVAFSTLGGVDIFASGTAKIKSILGADQNDNIEKFRNELFNKNDPDFLNDTFKLERSNAELKLHLSKITEKLKSVR